MSTEAVMQEAIETKEEVVEKATPSEFDLLPDFVPGESKKENHKKIIEWAEQQGISLRNVVKAQHLDDGHTIPPRDYLLAQNSHPSF